MKKTSVRGLIKKIFYFSFLSFFLASCSSMKTAYYLEVEKEVEENLRQLSYEFLSDEDRQTVRGLASEDIELEEGELFVSKDDIEALALQSERDLQTDDFLSDVFLNTFSLSSASEAELGLKESLSQSFVKSESFFEKEESKTESLKNLKPFIEKESLGLSDPSLVF